MNITEIAVGFSLVAVLLALAGYYGWRQHVAARGLAAIEDPDMRLYVRKQIRRRLLCSALLVVLAAMLVGWWILEANLRPDGNAANVRAARETAAEIFLYYWGVFLLVLMTVFLLATFDIAANARFGYREHRKLDAARHQMIAEEAAKYGRERDGHGPADLR